MIEVVLFSEEAESHQESESGAESAAAEPPLHVGIFADVEDGDPVGPGEELVLDIAGI